MPQDFEDIIGAYVLVGLDHFNADGTLQHQEQRHGCVIEADEIKGIVLRAADGTTFNIPPSLDSLIPAEPGKYCLRSTGEEIENPDYTITFSLSPRVEH